MSCDSGSSIGIFTGLEKDEIVEQHMTYSFGISVFKLLNFDKLNIGANALFWRQPELFVKDPYRAKPKNGFMLMLNASYKTSDKLNVLFDVGYKTKGFIPGQYLGETSIINLALEYKM
ncbi:MAG: hypothetical protein PG981_001059 [Wolbachia endosymbiont of Ctenocephalides orientis wCori]|nr:MAG: hypothetical protein PG981_001059 [Wolbachia endosymbiont of Ctenocephalides orientis wCori]